MTSENIFLSPVWQFFGVLATVLAIIISIIAYRRTRQFKELSYVELATTSLISDSVEEEFKSKVEISLSGQILQGSVYLVLTKFTNTGNKSIEDTDFKQPLTIDYGLGSQVVAVEIFDKNPPNLAIEAVPQGPTVVVTPQLLNQKSTFVLQSLVTDYKDSMSVSGLIKDSDIRKRPSAAARADGYSTRIAFILGFAVATLVVFGSFVLTQIILQNSSQLSSTAFEIHRHEGGVTIYIPNDYNINNNPNVSLDGLRIGAIQPNGEIFLQLINDYPAFSNLNFSSLPIPLCLFFQEKASNTTPANVCIEAATITQILENRDTFWKDNTEEFPIVATMNEFDTNSHTCSPTTDVCRVIVKVR